MQPIQLNSFIVPRRFRLFHVLMFVSIVCVSVAILMRLSSTIVIIENRTDSSISAVLFYDVRAHSAQQLSLGKIQSNDRISFNLRQSSLEQKNVIWLVVRDSAGTERLIPKHEEKWIAFQRVLTFQVVLSP